MGWDPQVIEWPFHRAHLRPLENTEIYITIHDNYEIATKVIYGWSRHNVRNCVKMSQHQEVEGHWSKGELYLGVTAYSRFLRPDAP